MKNEKCPHHRARGASCLSQRVPGYNQHGYRGLGTNIILSWPSYGYETYLIQYRQTLNDTDSWSQLANDYYANSTNTTTYTLYGLVPPPATNSGTGGGGNPMPGGTNSYSGDGTNYDFSPTQTAFYRVFHIPDRLVSFDGYQFDGPTFIPVDFADPDAPTNRVGSAQVLINGQATDLAELVLGYPIGGATYAGMGIYFDRLPNGTNTIQLLTTVQQSDDLTEDSPFITFSNAPQQIVVSNYVSYTNWNDLLYGSSYTFSARTQSNVDWEIDVYDEDGYFVNSETGYSPDGNISWTWDLTDYTGADRSDGDVDSYFYPYISITPAGGGDPGGAMPSVASAFPKQGAWLFSWLGNDYTDGTTNYPTGGATMTNAIHEMEGGPAEWELSVSAAPLKYGSAYSQTDRDGSWGNLQDVLELWNIRNFYYFGHGNPNAIGGDINTIDTNDMITGSNILPGGHAYLSSQWVHDNVVFTTYGYHPYRFVWLDGCSTAAPGGSWPWGFGMPTQQEGVDYFTNSASSKWPCAFVGWDVEIGGKGWGTISTFWAFRADWMAEWAGTFEETLSDAFSNAFDISSWVGNGQQAHLKQFGLTTMEFQQYNSRGTWPP